MRRNRMFVFAAIAAVFTMVAAGYLYANHFGVSQFVSLRGSNTHRPKIINPIGFEQYVMTIAYNSDESLSHCDGQVITPHGTGEVATFEDIAATELSGFPAGSYEVISAPTGPSVGKVSHNYGVHVSAGKGRVGLPISRELFTIKGDNNDARDCVCDELSDDGVPSTFFKAFGISCPSS